MKNEIEGQKMRETKHTHTFLTGSTIGKYPVVLDNGKTIIYINDKSKENEIRQKYTEHERHPDLRL
jgi:c-di-AMP phosphodiesterase-like protein